MFLIDRTEGALCATAKVILALVSVLLLNWQKAAADQPSPELWFLYHNELDSDQSLEAAKTLINRAAETGYTGVVLWCGGMDLLGDPASSIDTEDRIHTALKYAVSKHLNVAVTAAPFGYSVNPLRVNPNWAESSHIVGAQFQVAPSRTYLQFVNSFTGLENAGFESESAGWFDTRDAGLGVDTQVFHSGRSSGMIRNARGNARFRQKIALKPWRQYHLRLFYRSANFRGFSQFEVLDGSETVRFNAPVKANGSQNWTQLDYTFNSRDMTDGYVYFGVWGGNSGTLWFDDVLLEETALVYVTRRPGTPVKVYDPKNPGTVFQERADYDYVMDPQMQQVHPFMNVYHAPPIIKVPGRSRLSAGQIVAMDFYSVFPIPGMNQVGMCLTDQGVANWLKDNVRSIRHILPAGAGVLLEYDEMRQMNSCGSCRAKNMSAGELLAWNVSRSIQTFQSAMPKAPLYIWSDMFDPNHNAVKNFYYVEGDLAGSWKGLPANVTIMNWNLDKLNTSLRWFSGTDSKQPIAHQQIIAGWYDNGTGDAAARQELRQAAGVPGVRGLMYTTWNEDYKQMGSFAAAAKAAWPAYLASQSKSASVMNGLLSPVCAGAAALLALGAIWFRHRDV
jgi:hypothetical protein